MKKDLLDLLGKENNQLENNELKVEKNSALEEMIVDFKGYNAYKVWYTYPNKSYPAKDIETFSRLIPALLQGKFCSFHEALYLNNLINHCKDKKISIYTSPKCLFDNIGFLNKGKEIIIHGNIGSLLGNHMYSGKIIVYGNANNNVGQCMNGGEIEIFGDCKNFVGDSMFDGKIYLHGNYKSISKNRQGGKIYHNDKLCMKDSNIFI